jgi:AraC-like DNA-binding protein
LYEIANVSFALGPEGPWRMALITVRRVDRFDQTFTRTEWSSSGLRWDWAWSHYRKAGWTDPFLTNGFGIAIPLAGAFRRRAQGVTQIVDLTMGFYRRAGEEVSVAHPTGEPDAATVIHVDLERYAVIDDGDWPTGAFIATPHVSLRHRLLRRDLYDGAEPWLVEMRLADLVDACLRPHLGDVHRTTPATARRHRLLVADVCEYLHTAGKEVSLVKAARRVGCSPFHLCRIFKATTGMTLSQYRQARRVNQVLQRIDQGDHDLAKIAADTGFTDHSHMTRTVTAHLGYRPSQVRELFTRHVDP